MADVSLRPAVDDRVGWREYWAALGMPWRTEPEIDAEQQAYLAERRAVQPDIERGIYPFRNEAGNIKLTRADVEWLLATHESDGILGPVAWSDKKQRGRVGLDLRGADLRGQDLQGLPLARLRAGYDYHDTPIAIRQNLTRAARHAGAALLQNADLRKALLEGACLSRARLDDADLEQANLSEADLFAAYLAGASLREAHLERATLRAAQLDSSASLHHAKLNDALLADVRWGDVILGAMEWGAVRRLGEDSELKRRKHHDGKAKTQGERRNDYVTAVRAYLQLVALLREQGLNEPADRFAYRAQVLQGQVYRRTALLAGGEESGPYRNHSSVRERIQSLVGYLGSLAIWVIAGYGYRPLRSVFTYMFVVAGFAAGFYAITNNLSIFAASGSKPLLWYEALVLSISSFHGRGFFPTGLSLGDPLAVLAAVEAIVGLLIEIAFIATFTQRFFAR